MKDYLKDYYFLGALSVAILSGTMLTGKYILPFLLNRNAAPVAEQKKLVPQVANRQSSFSTSVATTTTTQANIVQPAPVIAAVDEQKVLEDQMDQVVADQNKASAVPQPVAQVAEAQRAPASVPTTSPTVGGLNMPILKKTRPKQGGNEWIVGKSSGADSHDLASVLSNADDNDIVTLETGLHDFGFHMIFVSKIEIRGSKETKLNFKDSLSLPKFKELKISDVELIFPDNDRNFISVGGGDVKFEFTRIKINHAKLTLNFREMVKVAISESQFSGVTFRFSNNSTGFIKDSYLEKAKNLVSLSNSANLEIINTQFYNFENVAITSDATETTFKAKNIKVAHGPYAFWGKFHKENTQIRESSFSNLKEFGLSGTIVNCSVCEKFNIER
jgi:hypothetical protein